jgi:transcriptional regulator with XRE-family HTH domain
VTNREAVRKEAERERRGKLLRDAIKHAELSQDAFAKRLEMDRSAINQMARGKRSFGSTVAARFTKDLGLPDNYFDPPAPEEQEDPLARLEALENTVGRQHRANAKALAGIAKRLEQLEQQLAPRTGRATRPQSSS